MNALLHLPRRARGAAAVELALILPLMLALLAGPLLLARFCWHYTAAHKAAQDAARYLSTVSRQEMREPQLALAAAEVAREIALTQVAELPTDAGGPRVEVHCGEAACGGVGEGALPTTVRVRLDLDMAELIGLGAAGGRGIVINVDAVMPYVGK